MTDDFDRKGRLAVGARFLGPRGAVATLVAAVVSSVLTFIVLIATRWVGIPEVKTSPLEILVFLSIVLIWGPAFALVPASILGFFVARPMARKAVARSEGGLPMFLLASFAAASLLWLLLRIVVTLANSAPSFVDLPSLGVFLIVGLCSALSWWALVVEPGRKA